MQLKYAFLSATYRKWNSIFLWPFAFHFATKQEIRNESEKERELPSLCKMIGQLSSGAVCDSQIFRLIFSQALTPESIFKKLSEQIVIPPPAP